METQQEPNAQPSIAPATPRSAIDDPRVLAVDLTKLRKLRKGLRLTQAELANLLDIHRTYLVLIEKGKKIPSPRLERAILEFMEKAEKQHAGAPALWARVNTSGQQAAHAEPATRRVPVVSWASAGAARAYEDLANQIEEYVDTDCKDPNAFSIIVEGDSMEEKFYAGDRVVFAPNLEPRNADAVVAKLTDGRVLFKFFYRTGPEGAKIRLVSQNPNYSPLELERQDFVFIYPAWEVKRRLRR